MTGPFKIRINQIATYFIILMGILLVVASAIYASSFLTILGASLVFWGAILLYITPSKHVPLALLKATNDLSNFERILNEFDSNEKGIYLPPANLKNIDSSIVYIPMKTSNSLPDPEEITEKMCMKDKKGLLLSPPGFLLSRLFEHELGISFTKFSLSMFPSVLPKLLVVTMELAEHVEIKIQPNKVNVQIMSSVLDEVCQQTRKLPHTHNQVGCPLTSALACALAKTSGKPIIIQKETKNQITKVTQIDYLIIEE